MLPLWFVYFHQNVTYHQVVCLSQIWCLIKFHHTHTEFRIAYCLCVFVCISKPFNMCHVLDTRFFSKSLFSLSSSQNHRIILKRRMFLILIAVKLNVWILLFFLFLHFIGNIVCSFTLCCHFSEQRKWLSTPVLALNKKQFQHQNKNYG